MKTIGEETVDGVDTTHYRAAIDRRRSPRPTGSQKLTAPAYKPIDAWVDGDGLVRQVKLDYTTKAYDQRQAMRAHVDC